MSEIVHNYNILCVDDNENNLFTLSTLLKTLKNVQSIEALNAKDALQILLTKQIDLILLDVQMPEINGYELTKMIKSNKKTKDIPIIFVTAVFKSEEFIKEGFKLGAVDYLTKPIDDNQLLNKISLYLRVFEEKNKVAQSEKRFYDIAQNVGNGVYILDMHHKTTFINNEALRILGFTYEELINKNIHDYIHYKDINNNLIEPRNCPVHNTLKDGHIYIDNDEYLVTKDGSFVPVSIVVTPLSIGHAIFGTVVVFTDKTHIEKVSFLEKEKIKNQEQMIHSMIEMIESRDSYTAGHTKRVAEYCVLIAKEMNYSDEDIKLLKNAAWLHDIGKISTPDAILLKPSKLNDTEYLLIQDHLLSGYEMLSKIDQYKLIANIILEHHEKFDGSGYPNGLKSEEIKPLSRIMIVADAFDAMTTNRVYKAKKTIDVALNELKDLSAKHFHPEVVKAALIALKNIEIDSEISQLPKTMIEEQRFSYFYRDRLTNLFIIDYLNLILMYHITSNAAYTYEIKLHNFSKYNKEFGWKKGDDFLIAFAVFISNLYPDSIIFRIEGDDFLILSEMKIDDIQKDLTEFPLFNESVVKYSAVEDYIDNFDSKFKQKVV